MKKVLAIIGLLLLVVAVVPPLVKNVSPEAKLVGDLPDGSWYCFKTGTSEGFQADEQARAAFTAAFGAQEARVAWTSVTCGIGQVGSATSQESGFMLSINSLVSTWFKFGRLPILAALTLQSIAALVAMVFMAVKKASPAFGWGVVIMTFLGTGLVGLGPWVIVELVVLGCLGILALALHRGYSLGRPRIKAEFVLLPDGSRRGTIEADHLRLGVGDPMSVPGQVAGQLGGIASSIWRPSALPQPQRAIEPADFTYD